MLKTKWKLTFQTKHIFKPALTGKASTSDMPVMNVSVSNGWGIGDLNFNPSGTLIHLIYCT